MPRKRSLPPERTIRCENCGCDVVTTSDKRQFCRACYLNRKRRLNRENMRRHKSTTRTRGLWKCRACGVQKPRSAYAANRAGSNCDDCRLTPRVTEAPPAEFVCEYQEETNPLAREMQKLGNALCYTCVHMATCRENIVELNFTPFCFIGAALEVTA